VARALVVGSGPNGLAAAITLARAGVEVEVREGAPAPGGGLRSEELTLPGYVHDVCSAIHPFATASPFFRTVPFGEHGAEWIHPPLPLAHPLDDGTAVALDRSLAVTADALGADGRAYRRLLQPLVEDWEQLDSALLGPILRLPRHPIPLARFGLQALRPARGLARSAFAGERARALFAGIAAHAILPLEHVASASFALVLATTAHAFGWPLPRGGSQSVANALVSYLGSLGGQVSVGSWVDTLPRERPVLLDVSPGSLLRLAGSELPPRYRRALTRFRHGPGAFKLDWALSGPIPWTASDCAKAGTVHLGGTLDEIADSERAAWQGRHVERPFVLLAQPSLFDPTRAPAGKHTAWAYCHVPNGSGVDMTDRIERQIERFAPGFRDLVVARSVLGPDELEARNPNLVGGDIGGGAQNLLQLVARPALRPVPYATPLKGVYLCSSSTPPGGGVHGMCGVLAAKAALRRMR